MLVLDRNVATKANNQERTRAFRPRSYVSRTEEGGAILEVELPGFSSEDVSLDIEGSRLTVTARRQEPESGESLICERTRGDRQGTFEIGEELDTENLEAKMRNGILTIRFEKRPERKPRRIKIKRG